MPRISPLASSKSTRRSGRPWRAPRPVTRRPRRRLGAPCGVGDVASDHRAREAGVGEVVARSAGDDATVPEHGEVRVLGDREQLVELVADEEDRHAGRLQPPDDAQQPLDLLLRQRGGGLVQDQQARVVDQGPGDGDQLPIHHRQAVETGRERDVDADQVQRAARRRTDVAPVDQRVASGELLVDDEVLGDGEVVEQREVLIDNLHAFADRFDRRHPGMGSAVQDDAPGVGSQRARDDLDERGLAGAVLARQAVDLAGPDRQADVVERLDAGEGLLDVVDAEHVGHAGASMGIGRGRPRGPPPRVAQKG
jgi:hypothetical protein